MTKFQFWPCFCTYKFMCALQKYGLRRTSLIRSVKLNFVWGTKMRKWGAKVRKLRTEIQNSGNFCTQRQNGRETNIPNFLGSLNSRRILGIIRASFEKLRPLLTCICIHERRLELSKAQRECRKEKQPAIMVLPKYSWPCSGGNCTTTLTKACLAIAWSCDRDGMSTTFPDTTRLHRHDPFVSKFGLRTAWWWQGDRPDDPLQQEWYGAAPPNTEARWRVANDWEEHNCVCLV